MGSVGRAGAEVITEVWRCEMTKDVFLISAEAEINRLSRLMNKASKAYWGLKDRKTEYAKMLYAGYLMNKEMIKKGREVIRRYKSDKNFIPEQDL